MFSFASDNASAVHPAIMKAISACNEGFAPPYGTDDFSCRLNDAYSRLFERETFVFPVSSGTAANGLALGSMTPSYGAVFCHRLAHIVGAEAGSVEFYSGGGRLIQLDGNLSKLAPSGLDAALGNYGPGFPHEMKAATVSVTQSTERGTLYSLEELRAVAAVARSAGLAVHMDGARFANGLVQLGCSPADMTWKSGVDAVSFGTTKNGTMMSEAVLVFDKALADVVRYKHKRAGFLHSKMRYFAAQLLAYIQDDLWLDNAKRANAAARRIADRLAETPGVELAYPVETNQIFAYIPPDLTVAFAAAGLSFRRWAGPRPHLFRLVMSYAETEAMLAHVEAVLASH
ncbi:MAG: low specificity L-threonine aldolase [Alphaproteobacteria bacterium]|nr:low specificity L-threonine aldolase [Alphaproteobacteria bacterium]